MRYLIFPYWTEMFVLLKLIGFGNLDQHSWWWVAFFLFVDASAGTVREKYFPGTPSKPTGGTQEGWDV